MTEWLYANIEHVLAILILVGRLGDVGSTLLITPTLKLESNVVARRIGWPMLAASLLVALFPYFSVEAGIVALVVSLMVSASNFAKAGVVRAFGEDAYLERMREMARRTTLGRLMVWIVVSCLFIALAGVVLMAFAADGGREFGYWFGAGLVVYAAAVGFWSAMGYRRLFRRVQAEDAEPEAV